jgi:hypothetical protein
MWAIAKSGVKFGTLTNADGTTETWRQPRLESWEIPKTGPRQRRPRPPVYWAPKVAVETQASTVAAAEGERADLAA